MPEIASELYLSSEENVLKGFSAEEQEGSGASRRQARPTILVVDDQQVIADTTMMVLNQSGFRAERAYSSQSGLEMALKMKPDYLLSDIVMPGMNGIDLAIRVRRELPSTVIVLISGQTGVTDLLRDAHERGHEFNLLAKPTHPEKLLEYLKQKAPHLWK
jgi:CheY-like chemotaxis protein